MSPARSALLRALPRASVRAFHSPFVSLNVSSPLTPSPSAVYEKQADGSPEPRVSSSGTRTYVVSEPDPSNTPYEVPSGAYPASASYLNVGATAAPNPEGLRSSTTYTTRAVPQNDAGVGESAAVRNAEAPGEMGRTGTYGGLGHVDAASAKPGEC